MQVKLLGHYSQLIVLDRIPVLQVLHLEDDQLSLHLRIEDVRLEPLNLGVTTLHEMRVFQSLNVFHDCVEWDSHFLFKSVGQSIFELVLNLDLLIENSKCNVLNVGDRRNFFVEEDFLSNHIDKEGVCISFPLPFFVSSESYPFSERVFSLLVERVEVAFVVLGQYAVHLTVLKSFNRIYKEHRLKILLVNLFHLLVFDNVRRFLQIDVEQEGVVKNVCLFLHIFLRNGLELLTSLNFCHRAKVWRD